MNKPYYQRIFMLIIDSLGIGATPDAGDFNSLGADTLGHLADHFRIRLQLPTLQSIGLGNIHPTMGMAPLPSPHAVFSKVQPSSIGISDRESQWEIMGLPTLTAPDIFINGIPEVVINQFKQKARRPIIANSLTNLRVALQDYGAEQLVTGSLIAFPDSSSTVWLAAHEETMSAPVLKKACAIFRQLLDESIYTIEKVNGILFNGKNPRDFYPRALYSFPIMPSQPTVLDILRENNYAVNTIGKTAILFGESNQIQGNKNTEWMASLDNMVAENFTGLCVADLGEFDRQYGKKRNPEGFGTELMAIDKQIAQLIAKLRPTDLLIVTANHGNDPTYPGELHTREYIPLLMASPRIDTSVELPLRQTLADIGATILDNFGLGANAQYGRSFLDHLM